MKSGIYQLYKINRHSTYKIQQLNQKSSRSKHDEVSRNIVGTRKHRCSHHHEEDVEECEEDQIYFNRAGR